MTDHADDLQYSSAIFEQVDAERKKVREDARLVLEAKRNLENYEEDMKRDFQRREKDFKEWEDELKKRGDGLRRREDDLKRHKNEVCELISSSWVWMRQHETFFLSKLEQIRGQIRAIEPQGL